MARTEQGSLALNRLFACLAPLLCATFVACATDQTRGAAAQSAETPAAATPARTESELLSRYEGQEAAETLHGKATYYSNKLSGRKTASGEVYDPKLFTAAHLTLPFQTVVRVTHVDSGRYIYARINDRGPFGNSERIIDLSYIAAERLGMLRAGVVQVSVEVLQ